MMKIPSTTEGRIENMSQTVWALENLHAEEEVSPEERQNLLRTHYEIQRLKEEKQEIPKRDRSFLYLQKNSKDQVLLVHGGHSTPAQYIRLGKSLFNAGMSVYCSLLPSEESVGVQRGGVPWQFSRDALELRYDMLRLLGDRIHVVGSSFGAVLAMNLALKKPVQSLVLLSPPLKPQLKAGEGTALALGRLFPSLFEKMVARSPHRWMSDRYSALREARRHLSELDCPILAVHAKNNMEVSPQGLDVIRKRSRHADSRVLLLEEGGHQLFKGPSAARVEEETLTFLQSVS
jgi:carboxylesterase